MAVNASKLLRWPFIKWLITGLTFLILFLLFWRWKNLPKQVITDGLEDAGLPQETIKYWVAVSAFETAGWSSQVFRDSNNLFAIIVPNSLKLKYGEGQTIYQTQRQSVADLVDKVLRPQSYPPNYGTLSDLVNTMASKGYFRSNASDYLAGVTAYYKKLF